MTTVPESHLEVMWLMRAGDWRAAGNACQVLNDQYPEIAAGWQSASQISMRLGSATGALVLPDL
jgi:hypothetical protein